MAGSIEGEYVQNWKCEDPSTRWGLLRMTGVGDCAVRDDRYGKCFFCRTI